MQFNLVNDQEQVAQFVRRGVALRCMALALRLLVLRGGACSVRSVDVYKSVGCVPRACSGSFRGQRLLCILDVHLRMSSWLWLCSAFGVVAFVWFLVFPLPPLPIQGRRALSSIVSFH